MARAVKAGLAYFALTFLVGTILGTFRVLMMEPRLGSVGSVLFELPLMLAASWMICAILLRRLAVPSAAVDRLVMGGIAFLFLMTAELALSLYAVGGSIERHFAGYGEVAPLLGLLGQIAFAVFPLLRIRLGRRVTGSQGV